MKLSGLFPRSLFWGVAIGGRFSIASPRPTSSQNSFLPEGTEVNDDKAMLPPNYTWNAAPDGSKEPRTSSSNSESFEITDHASRPVDSIHPAKEKKKIRSVNIRWNES